MKNITKLLGITALIAVIGLAFFGCKEEPDPTTKLCTCNPKAHLGIGETCNCGGEDCNSCTLQVYGNVGGINIYRKGEVENMTESVANVQGAYNADWPNGDKTILSNQVGKIIIITGKTPKRYEEDGKLTVELAEGMPMAGMCAYMMSTSLLFM